MRTDMPRARRLLPALALLAAASIAVGAWAAQEGTEGAGKPGADWQSWRAGTDVSDRASLQRGARNFTSYCLGCHSLKYERWSRLGADLAIPGDLLQKDLMPPGDKSTDYILTTMPAADSAAWFGKTPPDLSLIARSRGRDYLYQMLKTFYVDPRVPPGSTTCACP